jgi:hypothetical protein
VSIDVEGKVETAGIGSTPGWAERRYLQQEEKVNPPLSFPDLGTVALAGNGILEANRNGHAFYVRAIRLASAAIKMLEGPRLGAIGGEELKPYDLGVNVLVYALTQEGSLARRLVAEE